MPLERDRGKRFRDGCEAEQEFCRLAAGRGWLVWWPGERPGRPPRMWVPDSGRRGGVRGIVAPDALIAKGGTNELHEVKLRTLRGREFSIRRARLGDYGELQTAAGSVFISVKDRQAGEWWTKLLAGYVPSAISVESVDTGRGIEREAVAWLHLDIDGFGDLSEHLSRRLAE